MTGAEEFDNSEGLINVAGFTGSLKGNIQTHLVQGSSKPKKGESNKGLVRDTISSPSDLTSTWRYESRPEEEFYRQPARVETIPESALNEVNFKEIP